MFTSDLSLSQFDNAGQDLQRAFNLNAWRFTWLLSSGSQIHALTGPQLFEEYLAAVPGSALVQLIWGALMITGLFYLAHQLWQKKWTAVVPTAGDRQAEMALILLVWLFIPPLFYTIPILPVELHYLLPTYPAQFIVAGIAFAAILERLGRWRWTGWTLLGLSAFVQVWAWLLLLSFLGTRATPGGYGIPVKYHLEAADQARQLLTQIGGGEIVIGGLSEDPQEDAFAAVYDVLLRDTPHRFVDVSRSALFPAEASVILLGPEAGGPAAEAYLGVAGQVTRLPLRQDEGRQQILTLPASAAPEPEIIPEPTYILANWVNLFGYDRLQPGEADSTIWQIYWHPGANPDANDYHFFNHLLDGDGQLIDQQDAAAFWPQQWQAGDTVLSVFSFPRPAGDEPLLTMRTGMYIYPSLEYIPLLDVAGNPYSDAAEMPLTTP